MANANDQKAVPTVRELLDAMRVERKGTLIALVLNKGQLFYLPAQPSPTLDPWGYIYPVSLATAQKEAEFFGVPFSEE